MNSHLALVLLINVCLTLVAWCGLVAEGGLLFGLSKASLESKLTSEQAKQLDAFDVEQVLARADDKDKIEFHGLTVRELLRLVPNVFGSGNCYAGHLEGVRAKCVQLDQPDTRKNLHPFCLQQLHDLTGRCSASLGGFKQMLINNMPDESRRTLEKIVQAGEPSESEHEKIKQSCLVLQDTLKPFESTVEFLRNNGQPKVEVNQGGKWSKVAQVCQEKFL